MGTSAETLERWWVEAKAAGATHMLVVCDTYDYSDYPVHVMPGQDPREEYDRRDGKNMEKVMECYALHKPFVRGMRVKDFDMLPTTASNGTDISEISMKETTVEELERRFKESAEQAERDRYARIRSCIAGLRALDMPEEAIKPIEDWVHKEFFEKLMNELRGTK